MSDKRIQPEDPVSEAEICDKCGVLGQDRRTLWMACFYAMNELGVPFKQLSLHGVVRKPTGKHNQWGSPEFEPPPYGSSLESESFTHPMFTLRVCKSCRSGWMKAIRDWFRGPVTESHAYNCDEASYLPNDNLAAITVELERLRVETLAVEQRIALMLGSARVEEQRREAEDSTEPAK